MDFWYLSERDMLQCGVKDMPRCIRTMEEVFQLLKKGDYRMGGQNNNSHGISVTFPDESDIEGMPTAGPDRRFTAMPAYLGGRFRKVGFKCYGSNHDNLMQGLPRSVLMLTLVDTDTGAPVAYMSANILSAMRTGAVAGVGAKYLAPHTPERVAIIGPGTMSRYALDAFLAVYPNIREISIKGRGEKNIAHFIEHCKKEHPGIQKYTVYSAIETACEDADIVFAGTTRSENYMDRPFIDGDSLKPGALVVVASMCRLDKAFVNDEKRCICIADNKKIYEEDFPLDICPPALAETKESVVLNVAMHEKLTQGVPLQNLCDIICDKNFCRDNTKVYLFGMYGMAIEDVAWGDECYQIARRKNVGTRLELWGQSEL